MTFCVAARVNDGIFALADTRIVHGSEQLNKAKLSTHSIATGHFFVMTSGLRSVRDKALIYALQALDFTETPNHLYAFADTFGVQLRRVRDEDGAALNASQLHFNLHAIIGGQLRDDRRPVLFLVYPEGNWIEVHDDSPYFMIGRTQQARALFSTQLRVEDNLSYAANLAIVAFSLTSASATDVGPPIDTAIVRDASEPIQTHRYAAEDLINLDVAWNAALHRALSELPTDWLAPMRRSF